MTARLVSLATGVPPHTIAQQEARAFARDLFRDVLSEDNERLLAIFEHAGIENRSVCAPLDWYGADHGFAEKNALYVDHAVRLGAEVATRAMEQAGMSVRDIDHLVFVSSTGIAAPSIVARLANVLGLPAVSVPMGRTSSGLPVGVQLVGRPFEDELLLEVAIRLEESRGPLTGPEV